MIPVILIKNYLCTSKDMQTCSVTAQYNTTDGLRGAYPVIVHNSDDQSHFLQTQTQTQTGLANFQCRTQ